MLASLSGTTATWLASGYDGSVFAGVYCAASSGCFHTNGTNGIDYIPSSDFSTENTSSNWSAGAGVISAPTSLGCSSNTTLTTGLCIEGGTSGKIGTATNPTTGTWTSTTIDGSNTIEGVSCSSTTLCAAVDNVGNFWVALASPTGGAGSWASTNVNSAYTINGVSCEQSAVVCGVAANGNSGGTTGNLILVSVGNSPVDTALPTITGTDTDSSTLTANPGAWNNSPTGYAYQWQDCNSSGTSCVNISGATSSTFVLRDSDIGDTIDVVVTATNATGSTNATSMPTSVVTGIAPTTPTTPTISGTTTDGQTLTSTSGAGAGGHPAATYTYQWELCNSSGASCSNISGATATTYTLISADVGDTLRVVVTATNVAGSASATSAQTAVISGVAPANTHVPVITGSAVYGQTLAEGSDTWSGSTPQTDTYQWEDCNSSG